MRDAADDAIDAWPVGERFELLPWMRSLTLDVIMHTVFGVEAGARREELKDAIRAMLGRMGSRLDLLLMVLSRGRRGMGGSIEDFAARRRRVDELIYQEIARRREAPDLEQREDVFSMMLLARDEDGEGLSDLELRDELVTLLVAGHETTATGLSWSFDLLLHNPRVRARLGETLADGDGSYLDAVVKESLRLRPVVPGVGRVVRGEPFQLGEYLIPPGIEINPSIAAIHRRADCYPQPREFRPERFLGEGAPDTYTWVPFGGSTRRCLGASFATFEMKVVIERVLERARLEPVGRRPEKGRRMGVTIVPRRGVRVIQSEAPRPAAAADAARAPRAEAVGAGTG
jgi:cytochrome P450